MKYSHHVIIESKLVFPVCCWLWLPCVCMCVCVLFVVGYGCHVCVCVCVSCLLLVMVAVCVFVFRREKTENDRVLQEQMDTYRDEASTLRLDNAKLASKVCSIFTKLFVLCLSVSGIQSTIIIIIKLYKYL